MQPTIIRLGGESNPIRVETFEDAYSNARGKGRARRLERVKERGEIKVARQEAKKDKVQARAEKRAARQDMRQTHKDTRVARKQARKDIKVGEKLGRKEARVASRVGRKNTRVENRLSLRSSRRAGDQSQDDTLPEDSQDTNAQVAEDQYADESGDDSTPTVDNSGQSEQGGGDQYSEEGSSDEYGDEGYDDEEEGSDDEGSEDEEESQASGDEEMLTDLLASPFSGDMSFTPSGQDDIQDMSFSEATGRKPRKNVPRNRKTVIRNVENPIISPERIVIPREEASGAKYGVDGTQTGLIGLDARDDYDAPKKREIYLNAEGSGKTVAGINIKSAIIGVVGAVALIWLANKSGILKKA